MTRRYGARPTRSGRTTAVDVTICDVGPRDGLQNEPETLPPAMRAELVTRLAAAGVPRIEAVVRARRPRAADGRRGGGRRRARSRRGVELSGLVLNERGYERFAPTKLDRVNCTLAATETFNRRNGNASLDEAVGASQAIVAAATGRSTVTVSCAFGCPFEGEVDPGVVAALCERFDGGRARARGHDRRRDAVACGSSCEFDPRRRRLPRPQHAQHGLCRALGGARRRRDVARRIDRRARRLPVLAAARRATSRPRTSSGSSSVRAFAHGIDVDALSRLRGGSRSCSAGASRATLYRAANWPTATAHAPEAASSSISSSE